MHSPRGPGTHHGMLLGSEAGAGAPETPETEPWAPYFREKQLDTLLTERPQHGMCHGKNSYVHLYQYTNNDMNDKNINVHQC